MWFAGSPKSEIRDERQIILAICSAGESFPEVHFQRRRAWPQNSAVVRSTDATEPDTAVEDREGLLHSSREQEIRNRAYEIYLQRGGQSGYELEDWLQAERELTTN